MPRLRWRFRVRPLPGVDPGQNARNAARLPEPFLRNAGKQTFRDGGGRKTFLSGVFLSFSLSGALHDGVQRGDRKGAPAAPPLKGNLGDGAAGKEGLGLDDIDEPHGHSDDEGRARTFFQHVTGDASQRERGIADEDDGPVE